MKVQLRAPLWRRIARKIGRELFRVAENNDDPRIDHNGEKWLLGEIFKMHLRENGLAPCVVIDAGANRGSYTRKALAMAEAIGCRIDLRAFEPSPACLDILRREFGHRDNVSIIPAGLGDRMGEAKLYGGKTGSSQASFTRRPGMLTTPTDAIQVCVARLDEYFSTQHLARVDLLKLDVEGFELAALRGAGEQLAPEIIDVIQFEYGGTTMDSGATLRDICDLLTKRGYEVGKLFPTVIEMRKYAPWMEHYAFSNYVAISPRWLGSSRQ